jgi:hypothetical protein
MRRSAFSSAPRTKGAIPLSMRRPVDVNSELFLSCQLNGPWRFLSPESSLGSLEDSHRSVAILPSALVVEHLLLGASWAFLVSVGAAT